MEFDSSTVWFSLSCTSTYSPPTTVVWTKNREVITVDGDVYNTTQTVTDRVSSTYENVLMIDDDYVNIIGTYSCTVGNSIGTSHPENMTLKGNFMVAFSEEELQCN